MILSLQMLGTGDAFSKNYFNNNALLLDQDYTLLIDYGITAPLALHQLGRSLDEVDATLITHIHSDHVGGLGELALSLESNFGPKMTLLVPELLIEPLWNHIVTRGLLQKHAAASLGDIFNVISLKPRSAYNLSSSIKLELIPTPHIPGKNSYSILLNNDVFYSADMIFQPDLLLTLVRERGVRKILHDCQLIGPGNVHASLKELLSLPIEIQRMIYLMHYSDEKPDFVGHTGEMTFLEQHEVYPL